MIVEQYVDRKPLYARLASVTKPLIEQLMIAHGIDALRLECRVKSVESLSDKINRPEKSGKYTSCDDITDLCGIRVVLFTNEDCELLCSKLRDVFTVDEINSSDRIKEYEADRFGYLSKHVIVSLHDARSSLFEYQDLCGLKAEIQVRTVLQHAWAVLDWRLRYKSEIEVPKELRRKLFRISALLESADEQLSNLQDLAGRLREEYEIKVRGGDLGIPINLDSLKSFISQSEEIDRVLASCRALGVEIVEKSTQISTHDQAWSYLIKSLEACDIKTLEQFNAALKRLSAPNFQALRGVWDIYEGRFGIFTSLRILMLSQLPNERVLKIIKSFATGGMAGEAELQYFSSLGK